MSRICIYITHGGKSTFKLTAFNPMVRKAEDNIFVIHYDENRCVYELNNKEYTRKELLAYLSSLGPIYRLCCDGNLEIPMHGLITEAVTSLIETLKPEELILFSGTPECVTYINEHYLKPPLPCGVLRGIAVSHQGIPQAIKAGVPTLTPPVSMLSMSDILENMQIAPSASSETVENILNINFSSSNDGATVDPNQSKQSEDHIFRHLNPESKDNEMPSTVEIPCRLRRDERLLGRARLQSTPIDIPHIDISRLEQNLEETYSSQKNPNQRRNVFTYFCSFFYPAKIVPYEIHPMEENVPIATQVGEHITKKG